MTQTAQSISMGSAAIARPDDADSLPRALGRWRLLDEIGQGSLARVFRASPASALAQHAGCYAVKILRDAWHEHPQALELFRREAEVGRTVCHQHVIAVLDSHLDLPYYLVMPHLGGATLAARLARSPRLALPVALWIARQVAEGLSALHAAGWLHLDVKPSNIFLSPQGHVTLLDLGFARRLDEGASATERPVLGTLNYIAPELLTSRLKVDQCSDIYSLGVTLFEMLTGTVPFHVRDLAELAVQHRQGLGRNIQVLAPHLPTGVIRLVRRMLAKEPLRRPQSAAGVVERLVELEIDTLAERLPA